MGRQSGRRPVARNNSIPDGTKRELGDLSDSVGGGGGKGLSVDRMRSWG